jgi:RNA polymerase sigma factor (sigma-70 family)
VQLETPNTEIAFAQLYRAEWHNMVRVALLIVGDVESAKDCAQDAFLGLYRKPLRNVDAQVGYLYKSVVNAARSVLRRRGTVRRHLRDAELQLVDGADRPVIVGVEHAALMAALGQLSQRQREVLVLRYWSELSEARIAAALGIRPGTVKSAASRALKALETKLGGLR